MPLTVCIYEDKSYRKFYPLTLLRPAYTLRAGILPLYRRCERYFKEAHLCLAARDTVSPLVTEHHRDYPVNMVKRGEQDEVLFINGRIRDFGDLPRLVAQSRLSTRFMSKGESVAVLFKTDSLKPIARIATPADYLKQRLSEGDDIPDFDTTATLYQRLWQIMGDIDSEIAADFEFLRPNLSTQPNIRVHDGAYLINREDIFLGDSVEIYPGAVLDARSGPIYIAANTKVESYAAIYGPCAIGANSLVLAGKIAGSSIGHTCRVGGEVEESIFMPYVNKYHAGFIGHSVVGSWVNFGAMVTNSDLKNNYSTVKVTVNGESIDTDSIKVGSFIGDHTKFGIGTLLNTGISIGVCCNLFGGSLITDKEVPSFSWGSSGNYEQYKLEKALETAQRTTERRTVTLSEREHAVLQGIFEGKESDSGCLDL